MTVQDRASAEVIRRFLAVTDHAPDMDRRQHQYAGTLNPALRPRLDKRYPTLAPLPLPSRFDASEISALSSLAEIDVGTTPGFPLDIETIARVLFLSNGVTKQIRRGGQTLAFRAAPTTGALYHTELYLVTGDLSGLPAGVYHYGAHDHALRQLRAGDFRAAVVEATGGEPAVAHAPAIVVVTSVFWRNAWKYAARAYRHAYWDTGTMLPNTLAVAAATGTPARIVLGFADEPLAHLLGIDLDREGIIALVALGFTESSPPPPPYIARLDVPTAPYSARELDFPLIRQAHRATLLATGEDAAAWRARAISTPEPESGATLLPLPEIDPIDLPAEPIEAVIRRRGSSRRFAREPIALGQLSTLLDLTTRGLPSDALGTAGAPFNDVYVLVNAVDGLEPGTYVYHRESHALEPLARMDEIEARHLAHFLALDQELGGDAAVNIYLMADIDRVLATFGGRGYPLAQLGGALVAGKMYLAAYALGLGATGLTFYDGSVTDAFSPHAAGKRAMFLIAVGVPAYG
jgi:SagB-type dehydrogenase family enzyme